MTTTQSVAGTPAVEHTNVRAATRPYAPRKPFKVLFLCADNAVLSIMAEALLKRWGAGDFHAFSAGLDPRTEINPLTVDLLKTYNVWNHELRTRNCSEFLAPDAPAMDFIVTVGGKPPEAMPVRWPGSPQIIHWRITEPLVGGKSQEKVLSFKTCFRELETRIKLFVLVHQRETAGRVATAA